MLRTTEEPDERLLRLLANGSRRGAGKLLGVNQEVLLDALAEGEHIRTLVAEEVFDSRLAAVTTRRLLIVRKRRVYGSYAPERISRTRLLRSPNGTWMTAVDGPGLVLGFREREWADHLAVSIDRHLLAPPPAAVTAPRDIPELLSDYYRAILFATGKPESPENIVALINLIGQMLSLNAVMWFQQLDDPAAEERFLDRFRGGGPEERFVHLVDDMIDFLWAWRTNCHAALRDFVRDTQVKLSGPDSQLWYHGDELPFDMWSGDGRGE
ncbi:hypothetical protein ACIQU5_23460 [Streptomyces sp. NPDC090306]|uniref:hypothetical protein n=1 Tax=unclassified Streptomyces TaxID=2593676 RepID=UPI0036E7E256